MFKIRATVSGDRERISDLYKEVSKQRKGIAACEEEITHYYLDTIYNKAKHEGIQLVAQLESGLVAAEIHCSKLGPKVFNHVLGDLTFVVHSEYQGKGLGKLIFTELLKIVIETRPEILRVELIARESNTNAISLYKKLGFVVEGRFEKRIKNEDGSLEADIPMAWIRK